MKDEAQRSVTLEEGYYLGLDPVTQAQWRSVMGTNPSSFSRAWLRAGGRGQLDLKDLDLLPVESVSWHEAQSFCARLSERLGRRCRLPTEIEWERACRGKSGASYPYGTSFDPTKCNTKGNTGEPAPTGTFAGCRSAVGAFDMSGNVAEWVSSKGAPALKGGSAVDTNPLTRCSNTVRGAPAKGAPTIGFRCCTAAP